MRSCLPCWNTTNLYFWKSQTPTAVVLKVDKILCRPILHVFAICRRHLLIAVSWTLLLRVGPAVCLWSKMVRKCVARSLVHPHPEFPRQFQSGGGALTYDFVNFLKTAWKWEQLGRRAQASKSRANSSHAKFKDYQIVAMWRLFQEDWH